ncbi:hypothetical protein ACRARG_03295 [Pseudooceanicola sp. C21-150M6]|uniref:hypothetical protein n=1 Tax=Pseudooceanicola sp. C21-150M6 TaxID=3434355 RepID=UPI003D7F47D4
MLKLTLMSGLVAAGLSGFAHAQVIEQSEVPGPIAAQVAEDARQSGAQVDGIGGYELDLEGDGTTEWLVQPAYWTGGNSVSVRTFLFDGADTGYASHVDLNFFRSIKRVELDRPTLRLVIYELLDGDPRCCPTGESTHNFAIEN